MPESTLETTTSEPSDRQSKRESNPSAAKIGNSMLSENEITTPFANRTQTDEQTDETLRKSAGVFDHTIRIERCVRKQLAQNALHAENLCADRTATEANKQRNRNRRTM